MRDFVSSALDRICVYLPDLPIFADCDCGKLCPAPATVGNRPNDGQPLLTRFDDQGYFPRGNTFRSRSDSLRAGHSHHTVRSIYLSIAVLFVVAASLSADDLVLRAAPRSGQLLVLKSGRVLRGVLTPRKGGYDIVEPGGRIFVGSEQIHFLADDIDQAWQKLRDSKQQLTPDTHLDLARWCLNQKLYGRAKKEILDALHLDPYRADARQMLEGLIRLENSAGQPRMTNAEKIAERLKTVREQGALAPQRRSLGGLPEQLALDFTRTIQPLLSNKCSDARCHGPGQNDFVVLNIRRGVTPVRSEQNLASLIGQMDFAHPDESPVLKATYGLHGGYRQLLFPGQSGGRLRNRLRDWVKAAAAEMDPGLPQASSAAAPHVPPNIPQSATGLSASDDGVSPALQTALRNPGPPVTAPQDPESVQADYRRRQQTSFLHGARVAARHDDFDPDEFNRMVHGRTRSPSRSVGPLPAEPETFLNQAFSDETSRKESR